MPGAKTLSRYCLNMEVAIVVLLVALVGLGTLVGRWWVLAVPVPVWATFYLGLSERWWGSGVGDSWQVAALGVTALGVACTGVGVAVGRAFRRWPR